MKKLSFLLMALAMVTAAHAFSFSAPAATGQTLYFTITGGTNVKAVAPAMVSWSGYTAPAGALVIPATVSNGGTVYSVTGIDQMAFQDCFELTAVTVPGSVISIGTRAFSNDTLLASVVLQEGVQRIDMMAFSSCKSLTDIQLPASIVRIAVSAFDNTGYFNDNANWQDGKVLMLGQWVIKVGNLVEGTVEVPEGVRGIANSAFLYCRLMDKVELPSTLQIVGDGAFLDCLVLDTVRHHAVTPPVLSSDSFRNVPSTMTLAVPCSTAVAYAAAEHWNVFGIVEECDTTTPGPGPGPGPMPWPPIPGPHIGVDEVAPHTVSTMVVVGGVEVCGAEGLGLMVCDMAGRRVHTVEKAQVRQFLPLPATGVYVVLTSEGKSLKFNYIQ